MMGSLQALDRSRKFVYIHGMSNTVSDSKLAQLENRLISLGIRKEDLEETFVRGSGAGGQKINKTSSAVQIRHLPTGIAVRCQETRSQSLNRFLARRLLADKIEIRVRGHVLAQQSLREKIRRQKRRRSRRAKEKMLEQKKRTAQKKEWRGPIRPED